MENLCQYLVVFVACLTLLQTGYVEGFMSADLLGKGKRDGLELLTNIMSIKRIRASFAFKENKVYYMVRFCGKREAFCFVTNIYDEDNEKRNKVVPMHSVDVVRDLSLWMKLISVLNGKNSNIRPIEEHMSDDVSQKKCSGRYYLITKAPTKQVVHEILQESKARKGSTMKDSCTRTCLKADGLECHEIRISCHSKKCNKKKNRNNTKMVNKKRVSLKKMREALSSSS